MFSEKRREKEKTKKGRRKTEDGDGNRSVKKEEETLKRSEGAISADLRREEAAIGERERGKEARIKTLAEREEWRLFSLCVLRFLHQPRTIITKREKKEREKIENRNVRIIRCVLFFYMQFFFGAEVLREPTTGLFLSLVSTTLGHGYLEVGILCR